MILEHHQMEIPATTTSALCGAPGVLSSFNLVIQDIQSTAKLRIQVRSMRIKSSASQGLHALPLQHAVMIFSSSRSQRLHFHIRLDRGFRGNLLRGRQVDLRSLRAPSRQRGEQGLNKSLPNVGTPTIVADPYLQCPDTISSRCSNVDQNN